MRGLQPLIYKLCLLTLLIGFLNDLHPYNPSFGVLLMFCAIFAIIKRDKSWLVIYMFLYPFVLLSMIIILYYNCIFLYN